MEQPEGAPTVASDDPPQMDYPEGVFGIAYADDLAFFIEAKKSRSKTHSVKYPRRIFDKCSKSV